MKPSRRRLAAPLALALVAGLAAAQSAPPGGTGSALPERLRIRVDCDAGDRVSRALERSADELLIEIFGLCEEHVEIRRDGVTLRGGNAAVDGIRAPTGGDEARPALLVRDAARVTIENLRLTGSPTSGLRVLGSSEAIAATDIQLDGNGVWGASILDSAVALTRLVATGNGGGGGSGPRGGLLVSRGANVSCTDCLIEANPDLAANYGAVVFSSSSLSLRGGAVEGGTGVLAQLHSSATLTDVGLEGDDWAFQANFYAEVFLRGGSFSGAFLASTQSTVQLFGATQLLNPTQNFVTESSLLVADDRQSPEGTTESSTLAGLTLVSDFSNGKLVDNTVLGELTCRVDGRVYCDGTEVKVDADGCGLCP